MVLGKMEGLQLTCFTQNAKTMKNKALIIIALHCMSIPVKAVENENIKGYVSGETANRTTMIHHTDFAGEKAIVDIKSNLKKALFRPIKRKIRFRKSVPRCRQF